MRQQPVLCAFQGHKLPKNCMFWVFLDHHFTTKSPCEGPLVTPRRKLAHDLH